MSQSSVPLHQMENGRRNETKGSWRYQSCECCPYGYHIDLDFVRYCESVKQRSDYTSTMNKRRERRRQRQSMEVLLGLASPIQCNQSNERTTNIQLTPVSTDGSTTVECLQTALVQDALGDVVSDFERTWQRSANGNTYDTVDTNTDNLYRVSSNSSVSSGSGCGGSVIPHTTTSTTVNGVDIEPQASSASALALKNIRKQMALGLQRMKELEEQVKLIPALQAQISVLKDQKRSLLEFIKEKNSNTNNSNGVQTNNKHVMRVVVRRDASINCSVITRDVGVGTQNPKMRHTSSNTDTFKFVQKKPIVVNCASQTAHITLKENETQTNEILKNTISVHVTAKPMTCDSVLQTSTSSRTIGVSNDSIQDTFCDKCNTITRTIGVGPCPQSDIPISLKQLSMPRSRSFNLGEEKLSHTPRHTNRTIGCQTEYFSMNRACQYEPKNSSRHSQYEHVGVATKAIQHECLGVSQLVDTSDLSVKTHTGTNTTILHLLTKDAACNTNRFNTSVKTKDASCSTTSLNKNERVRTEEVACNTTYIKTNDVACNTTDVRTNITDAPRKAIDAARKTVDVACNTTISEETDKKEEYSPQISRIPRPANPVSSPSERHKFKRQDTYTKIPPTSTTTSTSLSGLDLSPVELQTSETEPTNSYSPIKPNHNESNIQVDILSETNDICSSSNKQRQPETSLAVSESVLNQIERSLRTKAVPSKEMQAALKVLNDYLHKSKGATGNTKSQVKNALNIIQQEWFRISSVVNADPLIVEDYLDRFEEMSASLLQYIVNMTDDNGNTAMHYAVSHGNFDVVSILLDSKVCNINKPNKAGYTSVMLVSLTDVQSSTDATVVRRLFQMADVNVRAKQHGQTALMLAVSHGRLNMVQMLLEAGADINIQDEDGSTALMCAAEHGHIDIVKYFLSQSECDSTIHDVDGSTALKIALEAGHKDIGVLLYAHEHSVHGISPFSSLRPRKSKSNSAAGSASVSRSPSRSTMDKSTK